MKSSIILASACATMALASPAIKRDIATEVVLEYVTVTVTGTGPSPTAPAPEPASEAGAFFSASSDSTTEETTVSSPAPETESAPAPSADTSNLSDYAATILNVHNKARAQHGVADLEWDDNLASIAELIGQTCVYEHNTDIGGGGYGQNIAAGASAGDVHNTIYDDMYVKEIAKYHSYGGEPDIGGLSNWGHATQIVWKGSTKVGCATVTCGVLANAKGMAPDFTICNYSPAGNMIGTFAENVLSG